MSRPHLTRGAVTLLALTLVGLSLAAATLIAGVLAALSVGCLILAAALLLTMRSLRTERRTVEARMEDVHQKYNSIIYALSSAIGLQDDVSASHARRVSDLTFVLAQEMRLPHDQLKLVQRAAILADIGKLEIAEGILTKEGELTDLEWEEMRRHPELGAKILAEVLDLSDAADIVLHHHERFDGQGYPHGLKGDQIPMGSRIYAVADAYVAMTSDRPHRKKMSHDMALREVLRNSLTQFDPDVVRGFVHAEEVGLLTAEEDAVTPAPIAGPRPATAASRGS